MLLFRNTSCFQKVSERYIDVVNTAVVKRFHNSHWHHDNVIIMLNYLHCTRYIPFFIFFNAHICHSNIAMKLVDWIFIMHLQFVIFKLGKTKLCNNFYIWKGRVRTRSNHYNAKILLTYENLMIFWRVYVRHFECGLGILIKQKFHCLCFFVDRISQRTSVFLIKIIQYLTVFIPLPILLNLTIESALIHEKSVIYFVKYARFFNFLAYLEYQQIILLLKLLSKHLLVQSQK